MASKLLMFCFFVLPVIRSKLVNKEYCNQEESCWPTNDEINEFYNALDPDAPRSVTWNSTTSPRSCSVPVGSKFDQPFYGAYNDTIEPVYYNSSISNGHNCLSEPWFNPLENNEGRQVCISSLRNNPLNQWVPAFVAWPLTTEHVSIAVKFAIDHNLCIMVAGTGHDFNNRHSCPNGLLIRTILLKSVSWNMEYNNGSGSVTLGTGHTFSEVAYEATLHNRLIAQGWAVTVGVAGWSFGGGHGPFANYAGLGIDQIISATIISANNGEVLFVNETNENSDLWWALRGGGGSTWGVVVDLTIQAHIFPNNSQGITEYFVYWEGNNCEDDGLIKRSEIIHQYLQWSLTLDHLWSGLTFITPQISELDQDCGGNWTLFIEFNYLGNIDNDDDGGNAIWSCLLNAIPYLSYHFIQTFANQWKRAELYDLEVIYPYQWLAPTESYVGGVASVLVSKNNVINGNLENMINERLLDCDVKYGPTAVCSIQQLYQDITGNLNAPQSDFISTNPDFRNAFFHYVIPSYNHSYMEYPYSLGNYSYFGESAYEIGDDDDDDDDDDGATPLAGTWKTRTWGEENYNKLVSIKKKYDPHNIFWCRHCIGDDDDENS